MECVVENALGGVISHLSADFLLSATTFSILQMTFYFLQNFLLSPIIGESHFEKFASGVMTSRFIHGSDFLLPYRKLLSYHSLLYYGTRTVEVATVATVRTVVSTLASEARQTNH